VVSQSIERDPLKFLKFWMGSTRQATFDVSNMLVYLEFVASAENSSLCTNTLFTTAISRHLTRIPELAEFGSTRTYDTIVSSSEG
jgi:hypothetical protein